MSDRGARLISRIQDWLIGLTIGGVVVALLLGKFAWDQRADWAAEVESANKWATSVQESLTARDAQLADERAVRAVLEARVALARVQTQLHEENFGAARRQVEVAAVVLKTARPNLEATRVALAGLDLHPGDPVPHAELARITDQLDDALNL